LSPRASFSKPDLIRGNSEIAGFGEISFVLFSSAQPKQVYSVTAAMATKTTCEHVDANVKMPPDRNPVIHKEECTKCFDNDVSPK
jgi:hypothetical protein